MKGTVGNIERVSACLYASKRSARAAEKRTQEQEQRSTHKAAKPSLDGP